MKRLLKGSVLLCASALLPAYGTSSARAEIHPHLCYIPGAGGGRVVRRRGFQAELIGRGVPAQVFDVGRGRPAQELAQTFKDLLQRELNLDPDYRCHIVGYSMGGIVARYALNHLEVVVNGQSRPARDYVLSLTTASTPHLGTPAAETIARFLGDLDDGMMQMGESQITVFNDPQKPDTYSPAVPGMPNYSYLSYLNGPNDTESAMERLGNQVICQSYAARNDPRPCTNDGVVPTDSQVWGRVLGRFHVPHGFFGGDVGYRPDAVDVYEAHWHYLNGTLKDYLRAHEPTTKSLLMGAWPAQMRSLQLDPQNAVIDVSPTRR